MTEEQLIQEYSDAVYPKIAKALISETKSMVIEKACDWLHSNCYIDDKYMDMFRKAMEKEL